MPSTPEVDASDSGAMRPAAMRRLTSGVTIRQVMSGSSNEVATVSRAMPAVAPQRHAGKPPDQQPRDGGVQEEIDDGGADALVVDQEVAVLG